MMMTPSFEESTGEEPSNVLRASAVQLSPT